ncbi:MAG: NTPase [Candidatus Coatesbacteria bacterium]|nr:NTPase [Candidatus Coatesbacteria bacterium]
MPGRKILITGYPGVGKTTLMNSLITCIKEKIKITGFVTKEIRDENTARRTGFTIEDFKGNILIMAHLNFKTQYRIGFYGVNIDNINKIALPVLREREENDLVIVDEIGIMELFSEELRKEFDKLFEDSSLLVATIKQKRNPVLDRYKSLDYVSLYNLERNNREEIFQKVLAEISKSITLHSSL